MRRERLPTPVFWPGEFHGYSLWGCKESDMTERLSKKKKVLFSLYFFKISILKIIINNFYNKTEVCI